MSNYAEREFGKRDLICPECGHSAPSPEWLDTEVYCEDCGDHPAIQCPECHNNFDMIFDSEIIRIEDANKNWRDYV